MGAPGPLPHSDLNKKPFICLVPGAHSRVYIVIITPVSGLLSFEQFISDALIRLMENKIFQETKDRLSFILGSISVCLKRNQ